jgi:hypothetical protein
MAHTSVDIIKVSAQINQIDSVDFDRICQEAFTLPKVYTEAPSGSYEKSARGYPFYSAPKSELFDHLRREIENTANEALPLAVEIYETWIAIVEPGQSIAYHTHYKNTHIIPEQHWSGVVFANAGQGSSELILHGYGFNRVESFVSITPEVGRVVFFNSFVPHFTTINDSDTRRVSMSFNLRPVNANTDLFPNNHALAPDNYEG